MELIISTKQGMELIRIINKLGIKEDLVEGIKKIASNSKAKELCMAELRKKIIDKYNDFFEMSADKKNEVTNLILSENIVLAKKLSDIEEIETEQGTSMVFNIITKIPQAEKEVYKLLADIFNLKESQVSKQDLDITFDQIMQIGKSKTFINFFKLINK